MQLFVYDIFLPSFRLLVKLCTPAIYLDKIDTLVYPNSIAIIIGGLVAELISYSWK